MNSSRNNLLSQVVILAGGRGERLRPLTDSIPKPMAPVNYRPFLDYLLQTFISQEFTRFLFLLGYMGDSIYDRYKSIRGITTQFSHGTERDTTGQRLLNAYPLLDDYFLLVYGDNYWPCSIQSMWDQYISIGVPVQTTIFSNHHGTGEYGTENNVQLKSDGLVVKYDKKRRTSDCNGVDIGFFIVQRDILGSFDLRMSSFEEDVLPALIDKGHLAGYLTSTQYHYITDMPALRRFQSEVITNDIKPIPADILCL